MEIAAWGLNSLVTYFNVIIVISRPLKAVVFQNLFQYQWTAVLSRNGFMHVIISCTELEFKAGTVLLYVQVLCISITIAV